MRQLVVDIGTSGHEPEHGHRVVELAAVELVDGKLTGKRLHRYLKPDRPLDRGVVHQSGLTDEFLSEQPRFGDVAAAFLEFVRGAELLIHNAPRDLAFLEAELVRTASASLRATCSGIVDTLVLANKLHPGEHNSLLALCARYGIDGTAIEHLGSLANATLLADVYVAGFASLRVDLPKEVSSTRAIWTPDMELELFAHLRKYPEGLFELPPRRFEELIAAIFRNNGFSVELTPQTRDGGIDIIAVQHSMLTGHSIHLVECKRYRPSKRVGIGVVQRLLGAVTQRQATKGILVATSSFTRDAVRVAEETRHVIALNDYTSIVGWLRNQHPSE
jgi:DNA polymerase III epsilon subunit